MSEGFAPAEDAVSVTRKGIRSPVTLQLSLIPSAPWLGRPGATCSRAERRDEAMVMAPLLFSL